ncbi:MAG: aspartate carbamoyltransferase regulatory subunit [Clostridia bacterium]|nr:aspartate carbamoyltransferase regulatory subunit [Clostridia bacterium]
MIIDAIQNGIVIDHIRAGGAMELYRILGLENLTCSVAIINNAASSKMGKKDIIKIDALIDLDLDVLGYVDPDITVNIIRNGERIEKFSPELPEQVVNVIQCRNPRCITTTEQELPHIFKLADRETRTYHCLYCETPAKQK